MSILKIGDVSLPNNLVLAPMAGITNLPFRIICRGLGAGLVVTELVSVEGLIRKGHGTLELLDTRPEERPVAVQIFGSNPVSMAESARILSDMGCWDFIDINMGCPVRKVLKSGSGSALLKDLNLAERVAEAVVKASVVPVTAKIRSGWSPGRIVAPELAKRLEGVGVAAIAVHARTREQGFSGNADWSVIGRVKEAVGIPVIGNGDVKSAADARRMIDTTGCDGVMIGRAARGNPWIFRETEQLLATGTPGPGPEPKERL
ncbi:MAG: tRNA dihydrouridine synthase DusB, partial [Nitrospirota bacterium]|nr:tRNA dihydrouridine synthase DusB [Nitrospirota bacterium]